MEENRLGSINKEGLLKNELPKGDLRGPATEVLRVVSLPIGRESVLLSPSSYRPYSMSFHSLERTFLRTFLRRRRRVDAAI